MNIPPKWIQNAAAQIAFQIGSFKQSEIENIIAYHFDNQPPEPTPAPKSED